MHYYVYYSYETWGRGYIGKRECECKPEEDTKYFGSFKDKSFKPIEKIILFECQSRKKAYEIESQLHIFFDVAKNPHFANRSIQLSTSFSFSASGEDNPNFGGGHLPESSRQSISEKTSLRLIEWDENPFRKKGEESMSHGRKWVTTPEKDQEKYLKPGEEAPKGWISGRMKRPPRSDESRERTRQALKGKPKSESHKNNIREATLNYYANKGKTP
jgi:hypothetical protein